MNFLKENIQWLLALCILISFSPGTRADSMPEIIGTFRNGEIIAELKPGASIDAVNARNRTTTIHRISGTNFYRLLVPEAKKIEKWLKRMAADRDVLSASLNPVITSPFTVFSRSTVGFPDGHPKPGHYREEYLSQPDLFSLLRIGDVRLRSRGAGVVVAVIDTGIDRTHPDLVTHLWVDPRELSQGAASEMDGDNDGFINDAYGWDFIDNDNDPAEQSSDSEDSIAGHGTFIAGLIALIAPDAQIMPIRAFNPEGISNAFIVADAIKYAADHGADVINLSFGSANKSQVVKDAIKYAAQRGATLVAAMGNDDQDTDSRPSYPANMKHVLGIAAIDADSRKAPFSNFGSKVAVSAPGVRLTSTFPGLGASPGDYAVWSGTSFAAPLTSAEAALIIAEDPRASASDKIEETAFAIDSINAEFSGKLGKGRIDLIAALDSIYMDFAPAGNYTSIRLVPVTEQSKAEASADTSITGYVQELEITARGLDPRARYTLLVDGKQVSPNGVIANNFGGLALVLTNESRDAAGPGVTRLPLPTTLKPVTSIKHIELRKEDRVVLQGDFAPGSGPGSPATQVLEKKTPLSPIGYLPRAAGIAYMKIAGSHQEMVVKAVYLVPDASYTILADGVELGRAIARTATSERGVLRFQMIKESSDTNVPPSIPQLFSHITRIEVRDSSGLVALAGDFLPDNGHN